MEKARKWRERSKKRGKKKKKRGKGRKKSDIFLAVVFVALQALRQTLPPKKSPTFFCNYPSRNARINFSPTVTPREVYGSHITHQ